MHAALPFTVPAHEPVPTRTIIVVCPDTSPHYGFRSPPLASVITLRDPKAATQDVVDVAITPAMERPDHAAIDKVLKNRFGIDVFHPEQHPEVQAGYDSDAYHALADVLGYASGDMQLIYGD
jgi:hypothetical protein